VKSEIYEIPYRAELCYKKNKGLILPEDVPYIGMGASNIATQAFPYVGINILPEKAAEYYNYLVKYKKPANGVLISQSGQSSETLWCADYFRSFVAIVNNPDSDLGRHKNCKQKIFLHSGDEQFLATKTYINTLLVLYLGFGFDPVSAVESLKKDLLYFEEKGIKMGETIRKQLRWKRKLSVYVLGNGPNIATANIASLVLSSVTKMPVLSMSASHYNHGFIETARKALVIAINHEGQENKRTKQLLETVENAGGKTCELDNPMVDSLYSPLTFPIPFYFAAEYLAGKLKVKKLYTVGQKITKVEPSNKND